MTGSHITAIVLYLIAIFCGVMAVRYAIDAKRARMREKELREAEKQKAPG